jgi:hypothetical protein
MSSPPLTDREYAYIVITGPGRHETITQRLGLEPSEAWNVGDQNPNHGKICKTMQRRLKSGLDDTHRLNEHVESLLLWLGPKADALRELCLEYDITLQCVGYYPPSGHGAHFNRETILQAASLGIALDLDFYYVDDGGHDG